MKINIDEIDTLEKLKEVKNKFFGPDSDYKKLQMEIRSATPDRKKEIGKQISELKKYGDETFLQIQENITNAEINKKLESEYLDVTEPVSNGGSFHPMKLVEHRFRTWLLANGYYETIGSEIELDKYNFELLNIPKDHPARDMQDTLYIDDETVMRTHNTGFTARELAMRTDEAFGHFTMGNVFRNDEDDQTHSHQFRQCDLVNVGYVSFPNLIWTLKSLMSYVLESNVDIRLRPSYFPFTEPSVEVDVKYNGNWMEVLGAGMLNQKVLDDAGYTNDMNAFAAGIGIDRITMIKYGITDIRELYTNDLRFLKQFKGAL